MTPTQFLPAMYFAENTMVQVLLSVTKLDLSSRVTNGNLASITPKHLLQLFALPPYKYSSHLQLKKVPPFINAMLRTHTLTLVYPTTLSYIPIYHPNIDLSMNYCQISETSRK